MRRVGSVVPLVSTARFVRVRPDGGASEEGGSKSQEQQRQQQGQQTEGNGDSTTEAVGGLRGFFIGLRNDVREFPDIYNPANALCCALFTIFFLASTGSTVESEWWLNQWGIDGSAIRPLSWFLHSFMMNNFFSMAFALLVLHGMSHALLTQVGSKGLLQFIVIVASVSGMGMAAATYAAGYTAEKQFGPWDLMAAFFVVQARQGIMPWSLLNSFGSWVKYASWVGAISVMWFNWQPVIAGAAVGWALCRMHPLFRILRPPQ